MDGPKHRRLILWVSVLLAGGAVLLLDWQRTSTSEQVPEPTTIPTSRQVEPQRADVEPPTIEAAAPNVAPPPAPTAHPNFRGRVIDAVTRQPVAEFAVQLIRVRREAHTEDRPISQNFKSAEGRFAWSDVAAGTWRAAVSARGYQMFNVSEFEISENKTTREIVVPLLRGFAIRGRVFDANTRDGVAGAHISFRKVDAENSIGKSSPMTQSGADGSFTLDGAPGGDVVLMVGARNHAYRELTISVDEKTPPVEIGLSTGATIAGTVMTTAGVPATGRVLLSRPGGNGALSQTNEAGQFSFNNAPPGRYRVSVDTSAGSAQQEFVLAQDEVKQDITLIVGAGRSVRGMLKGLRPEQLQDAHILLRTQSQGAAAMTRPDEQGAYAFNGVSPGQAEMTVLTANRQFEKQVNVPADRDITVDIDFPAGARLSGRVTKGGKPAVNRNVLMKSVDDPSDVLYRARTSPDGQYEIEGLPAGNYRLRVEEDISRDINISDDVVLNIDIPAAQLSARVVEEGGTLPIVDAKVFVRGTAPETARVRGDKQTDDFGQFTLTGIEPGEIVLMVYKPGYELYREKITYSAPMTNRTIALKKSAGVTVQVQPGSRRFPRGFTVTLSFPGNDYVVDLWMPKDREGRCYVPSALAGTTFQIGRFSGEPIEIEDWDGQPFELP